MTSLLNYKSITTNMDLIKHIENYWSVRAEAFGKLRREELAGEKAFLWQKEIYTHLPNSDSPLKILDVGTGSGFFAILLAKCGHLVTGVDLSSKMIEEARKLAARENCHADFIQMDVCAPIFAGDSFDCILGRNITWTLPEPEKAYREWLRILKPGGKLINFDADYGKVDFTSLRAYDGRHAHAELSDKLLQLGEKIRRSLPISSQSRPQWDLNILRVCGFKKLFCDRNVSDRVYAIKDSTYNPVPMFAIGGSK